MKYQITLKVRGKWEPQPHLIFDTWDNAANWAIDNNLSLGYANIEFEILEKKEETRKCEGFSGPCKNTNAKYRLQHTAYADENSNWKYLCPDCQNESNEYWDEQWKEYYAGRL
jgi:DNA-directed RNA polymerase subunit M/transcription elongation factor TFIIS